MVTVAERPGRVIVVVAAFVLGGATSLSTPASRPGAMTVVLAFWLVLGLLGTARLLGAVRAADRRHPDPAHPCSTPPTITPRSEG